MKDQVVTRLLPPESLAIAALSQTEGISVTTLEPWRGEALTEPAREGQPTAAAQQLSRVFAVGPAHSRAGVGR